MFDLHANIPIFIPNKLDKIHDVNILDELIPEVSTFYIFARVDLDFDHLHRFELQKAFFITRTKSRFYYRRSYSHQVDTSTRLKYDQMTILAGFINNNHILKNHVAFDIMIQSMITI